MRFIPTRAQWRRWSLPSKAGYTSLHIALFAIILSFVFYRWPVSPALPPKIQPNVTVGNDSVAFGQVSGSVGDRSVVIGATDSNGNTILNQPIAVGYNAHAGPGSIAIGANAGAGSALSTNSTKSTKQEP